MKKSSKKDINLQLLLDELLVLMEEHVISLKEKVAPSVNPELQERIKEVQQQIESLREKESGERF